MLSEMFDRLYEHTERWSLDDPSLMRYRLLMIIYKSYDARMKEAVLILINA